VEKSLGVALFDRTCRPAALTAEGRRLEGELRPCVSQFEKTIRELRLMNHMRLTLRIGFIDSFSYDIAPAFIRRIAPDLRGISCLTGGADRLTERLAAQEVDIILSINPCFEVPGLRRFRLLTEPSVLIFPKGLPRAGFRPQSWEELATCGLPFIHNYESSGGGRLEDGHFRTHDIPVTGSVFTDSIGMRMKLVSEGLGWAIIRPLSLLQHMELMADIRILSVPSPGISRSIFVLGKGSVPPEIFSKTIRLLHEIIETEITKRILPLVPEGTRGMELHPLVPQAAEEVTPSRT